MGDSQEPGCDRFGGWESSWARAGMILTPDQRVRMFISSTLGELAAERVPRPGRRRAIRQGRGLGRKLVTHGLQRAGAGGYPAFLETGTPGNVPFYQSLGFQIVEQQQAPDGGPVIWFMQTPRPAHTPTKTRER